MDRTWARAAARDVASRAGRSPLVSPNSVASLPQAAAQRQERKSGFSHRLAFPIENCSKSKKKVVYVPGPHGRRRGGPPKRLPPEPYFRPPGVKIHFLTHPPFVSAGAERHRVGWVPALPAGFLSNVKPRDVQEVHRATLWRIWGPESHRVAP